MASVTMSPIRLAGASGSNGIGVAGGGSRPRKITVNERVEQILQGSLQLEDGVNNARCLHGSHVTESAAARAQQMSNLYSSSVEGRFVLTRMKAQSVRTPTDAPPSSLSSPSSSQHQRTRRVPPIAHISDSRQQSATQTPSIAASAKNVITSPIKPVRCLSLQMLEQQRLDDALCTRVSNDPVEPLHAPLKPWYKGCSSSTQLPVCSLDAKVRRYGAFGTAKMLAAGTTAGTAPVFHLHASQSLDALAVANAPSPWSPALHGSPTLWPEDANYATGCALEPHGMPRCASPAFRFPTHSVSDVAVDSHLARTKAVHSRDARELERALEQEKTARKQQATRNRDQLNAWHARVDVEPIANKLGHAFVKVNAIRAKECTIVYTPAALPTTTYDAQIAQLTAKRFELRWRNLAVVLDVMRRTSCRRPVLQDVEKLYMLAYEFAHHNANAFELTRQQFVDVLQREYPNVELRHLNRVFSSYDYRMRDGLDIRVLLGTVRALRVQQGTPIDILTLSLQDFDTTKHGVVSSVAHFTAALSLCCSSECEEQAMAEHAAALWTHMMADCQQYHAHVHSHYGSSSNSSAPGDSVREAYESSPGDGTFSIQYVRLALQTEKRTLALYSELLLARREECFRIPIPPSR